MVRAEERKTALPVIAVILVTLAGGLTARARHVTQTAVAVHSTSLGLGLISLLGALGTGSSPDGWFYLSAASLLGVSAAGLIVTVAMLRSSALREAG